MATGATVSAARWDAISTPICFPPEVVSDSEEAVVAVAAPTAPCHLCGLLAHWEHECWDCELLVKPAPTPDCPLQRRLGWPRGPLQFESVDMGILDWMAEIRQQGVERRWRPEAPGDRLVPPRVQKEM